MLMESLIRFSFKSKGSKPEQVPLTTPSTPLQPNLCEVSDLNRKPGAVKGMPEEKVNR